MIINGFERSVFLVDIDKILQGSYYYDDPDTWKPEVRLLPDPSQRDRKLPQIAQEIGPDPGSDTGRLSNASHQHPGRSCLA